MGQHQCEEKSPFLVIWFFSRLAPNSVLEEKGTTTDGENNVGKPSVHDDSFVNPEQYVEDVMENAMKRVKSNQISR